jgi:plastocyanin
MTNPRLLVAVAAVLLVAGCGSNKASTSSGGTTGSGSTQATFVLSEFKVTLDGAIPAGQVELKIDNQGGEKHEVVIVAAKDANALPKKADGSVDEDKIPDADKIGESGDVDARTSTTKTFTFKPGTYVAFCNLVDDMGMTSTTMMNGSNNMSGSGSPMGGSSNTTMMGGSGGTGTMTGHVHFAQGMHTTFTVK